ncbi:hypothetical protein Hdeb2414_s0007g00262391 [Helianthus debilis subsp. tardiflorus]
MEVWSAVIVDNRISGARSYAAAMVVWFGLVMTAAEEVVVVGDVIQMVSWLGFGEVTSARVLTRQWQLWQGGCE